MTANTDTLREALKAMVAEKCDYMKINNLGDPEQTHTIKQARAALACPVCGSQMIDGRCAMTAVKGSQCRANARAALAQSDDGPLVEINEDGNVVPVFATPAPTKCPNPDCDSGNVVGGYENGFPWFVNCPDCTAPEVNPS